MMRGLQWAPNTPRWAHTLPQPPTLPLRKWKWADKYLLIFPLTCLHLCPSLCNYEWTAHLQLKPTSPAVSQSHRPQTFLPLVEWAPAVFSFRFYIIHFPLFTGWFLSTYVPLCLPYEAKPLSRSHFLSSHCPISQIYFVAKLLEWVVITGCLQFHATSFLNPLHSSSTLTPFQCSQSLLHDQPSGEVSAIILFWPQQALTGGRAWNSVFTWCFPC